MSDMLSEPFMQQALVAGVLIGAVCALFSIYVVLRRITFLSVAVSQVSAVGIAAGILAGLSPSESMVPAVVLSFGALFLFAVGARGAQAERNVAFLYAAASSTAVVLLSLSAKGDFHLLHILRGSMETVINLQTAEKSILAVAILLSAALFLLFQKEFLLVSFDPETADASGYRTRLWNLFLFFLLGVVITVAIRVIGLLLTFTHLTLPALFALLVARSIKNALLIAVVLAVLASFIGLFLSWQLYISYGLSLPSAPTIGVVAAVAATALLLFKLVPKKGEVQR